MQQIYRQRDEQLEVYTTVFSPQVCRTRTRHVQANKVVAARIRYRSRWPKELDLDQGDLIQVLFKEDEAWWFGRLMNGDEGYFPVACVESLQGGDSSRATPTLLRRGSVPVVPQTAGAPCGCTRTNLQLDSCCYFRGSKRRGSSKTQDLDPGHQDCS
ncbi:jouberin isoform X2 [Melanotaenia boesemani]|uniref:jouberin isoform X2 n=1 Tax=Melanotaenia boesemani TaxID=1250792 RepID=UPI001C049604|nr:jouberin isoform X2 [Melanotaenia boesemani]